MRKSNKKQKNNIVRCFHENGQPELEYYYRDTNLHRLDGPAISIWNHTGELLQVAYYINGEEIKCSSEQEFKRMVKLMIFK